MRISWHSDFSGKAFPEGLAEQAAILGIALSLR
jgi:hypothetical protein